jgi:hypothetical protein
VVVMSIKAWILDSWKHLQVRHTELGRAKHISKANC